MESAICNSYESISLGEMRGNEFVVYHSTVLYAVHKINGNYNKTGYYWSYCHTRMSCCVRDEIFGNFKLILGWQPRSVAR